MKRSFSLFLTLILLCAVLSGCNLFGSTEQQAFTLDKTELSMTVGDSVELSAGEATKVTWTSSDDNIASVKGGTVSAKTAGSTVITASLENGATASCNVTVTDRLITEIKLNVTSTRVDAGKTIQLTATYSPSNASDTALKWSSGDESVAIVNSEGYVTAVANGVTNIKCSSSNGVEATCTVTVGGTAEAPTQTVATTATEAPSATEASTSATESKSSDTTPIIIYSSTFIFPESSARRLSDSEIKEALYARSGYSPSGSYAQDAINEIYARNGYVFKSNELSEYFSAMPWYTPNPSFSSSQLNEYELYNIALLGNY